MRRARAVGFLGPGPVEPHVEHALSFAVVEPPGRALDLGSGGGLPALPLALHWPASRWLLVEANGRRGDFLRQAVADLGLAGRIEVRTERAEALGREVSLRGTFDLVTARSFGSPAVTAECGAPFLAVGGHLVVSEPPVDDARRWDRDGLGRLGLVNAGRLGSVRLLRSVMATDERYPRRVGVPTKRPLWR